MEISLKLTPLNRMHQLQPWWRSLAICPARRSRRRLCGSLIRCSSPLKSASLYCKTLLSSVTLSSQRRSPSKNSRPSRLNIYLSYLIKYSCIVIWITYLTMLSLTPMTRSTQRSRTSNRAFSCFKVVLLQRMKIKRLRARQATQWISLNLLTPLSRRWCRPRTR